MKCSGNTLRQWILGAAIVPVSVSVAGGAEEQSGLHFDALETVAEADSSLPDRRSFQARDGAELWYRYYPADKADANLIFIHGSGVDSVYLHRLANALSENGVANVYTPDLRGHGPSPARRGDIDYIGQLEHDVADFMDHVASEASAGSAMVLGGHSSGGGLALRFAGSGSGAGVDGYVLLAPYLGHDAPTAVENSGGWAEPLLGRIILLSALNAVGLTWFNGTEALRFNMPEANRTGKETLAYSYRMMTGINPRDYAEDLQSLDAPLLVAVGADDEAFQAAAYPGVMDAHAPHARVEILEGVSHLDIVQSQRALGLVARWVGSL